MILFIYDTGGAGVEVYDQVRRNKTINERYSEVYFVDDFRDEEKYCGTKTIHFTSCSDYAESESAEFIIAAGEPKVREMLYNKVKTAGYPLATLIDETAIISESSKLEEGCFIGAQAIVSAEAVVECNCMIMFQTIIGHHAKVGANGVICPQATVGGHSEVGEQTFLGLASHLMQGVKVGNKAIVGMGSMVFRDVEDGVTVIGNPARVTKGDVGHMVFAKKDDR